MWHKFPYLSVPVDHGDAFPELDQVVRPTLSVVLWHGERRAKCMALVDSGADFCVFPMSVAHALGLERQEAKHVPGISGYGYGQGSALSFWKVTLAIGTEFSVASMVGFSEQQEHAGFGLLGQRGFFSEVEEVSFSHKGVCFAFKTLL